MSPELLDPEQFGFKKSRPTRESDCYALGMVVYEVLSGRAPFAPTKAPVLKVMRGERPERPRGAWFTDNIWRALQLCWSHRPGDRISAKVALLYLEENPSPLRSPPNMEGIVETDTDNGSDTTSSDSGTLSPFNLGSQAHLRPCDITGPSITRRRRENELPIPLYNYPPGAKRSLFSPDGGGLSVPSQQGGSKEGWVDRLARNARGKFNAPA